jgi:hypothetical protein
MKPPSSKMDQDDKGSTRLARFNLRARDGLSVAAHHGSTKALAYQIRRSLDSLHSVSETAASVWFPPFPLLGTWAALFSEIDP